MSDEVKGEWLKHYTLPAFKPVVPKWVYDLAVEEWGQQETDERMIVLGQVPMVRLYPGTAEACHIEWSKHA